MGNAKQKHSRNYHPGFFRVGSAIQLQHGINEVAAAGWWLLQEENRKISRRAAVGR